MDVFVFIVVVLVLMLLGLAVVAALAASHDREISGATLPSIAASSALQQERTRQPTEFRITGLRGPIAASSFTPSQNKNKKEIVYVAEQIGLIKAYDRETSSELGVVLDVRDLLVQNLAQRESGNVYDERGLLGMAIDFSRSNLYIYLSEDAENDDGFDHVNVLYRVPLLTPLRASPDFKKWQAMLKSPHPQYNHNGGAMQIYRDRLYLVIGDGGGANDEADGHNEQVGNAQDANSLLGKVWSFSLNINNNDNDRRMVAMGVRNSLGLTFDQATGDLYLCVVGEGRFESIYKIPSTYIRRRLPVNLGWRFLEGPLTNNLDNLPKNSTFLLPIAGYCHSACEEFSPNVSGLAVVGGAMMSNGTFICADWSTSFSSPRGKMLFVRNARSARVQTVSSSMLLGKENTAVIERLVRTVEILPSTINNRRFVNNVVPFGRDSILILTNEKVNINDPSGMAQSQQQQQQKQRRNSSLANACAKEELGSRKNPLSGNNVTVMAVDHQFCPSILTVKKGTRVCWKNLSSGRHNVVQTESKGCSPALKAAAGGFNSGEPGFTDEFCHTFNETGVFNYKCEPHCDGRTMFMSGQVIVV